MRVLGDGEDDGARLVALLNEVVFVVETRQARVAGVRARREGDGLLAELDLVPADEPGEGIGVKAATYHQLAVEERPDGSAEVRVFLDV